MNLQKLLEEGSKKLSEAGLFEAGLDARYLLLDSFHIDLVHFLLDRGKELEETEEVKERIDVYREKIRQRSERIPLQYLTGSREFMGLEFNVNSNVLIPRQDTETLVEEVLRDHADRKLCILDMCTGSGCIAISLFLLGGFRQVAAVDVSLAALEIAKDNALRLLRDFAGEGCRILEQTSDNPWKYEISVQDCERLPVRQLKLFHSDLFAQAEGLYDLIISNPPYIPTKVIEELEPEVKDHEPRLALDGKDDGLYFYRLLSEEATRYLKPGGQIYLEIGYDQSEAVSTLLTKAGFTSVEVIKDAPGQDRVVKAIFNNDYSGGFPCLIS